MCICVYVHPQEKIKINTLFFCNSLSPQTSKIKHQVRTALRQIKPNLSLCIPLTLTNSHLLEPTAGKLRHHRKWFSVPKTLSPVISLNSHAISEMTTYCPALPKTFHWLAVFCAMTTLVRKQRIPANTVKGTHLSPSRSYHCRLCRRPRVWQLRSNR